MYLPFIERESCITYFDGDNFKNINDTYGHGYGDECLKIICECIRKIYDGYGKCFRIGCDELCVILNRGNKDVELLNQQFFGLLEERRREDTRIPYVSIGYVYFDPSKNDIEEAIKEADQMMYVYKKKNKIHSH